MAGQEKEETWLIRIFSLIRQSPLLAVLIWFALRDLQREKKTDTELQRQEQRDSTREVFDREQLIYYRGAKNMELYYKERDLNERYAKDTIK